MSKKIFFVLGACALIVGCASTEKSTPPLACTDEIKSKFQPDALTKIIAVRAVKKGEQIIAVDAPTPITMAADMCLVKLLVGPGVTKEPDKTAKSFSEGIGIEVWLPAHANWNDRIRDYGGGGPVGGGHRYADKIGSKVPALVNANMGYVSATTDAGQPHYQDPSFAFLSNGQFNEEAYRDFSHRSLIEQAKKSRALATLYYGRAPKFAYFDGHSQGGRQGMKLAQENPELYDGFMIAQPALNVQQFGPVSLYPQLVMKDELGFTALDKPRAAAFAKKMSAATARAVAHCDKEGLGFLLDPFACDYRADDDAELLCMMVPGARATGTNTNDETCLTRDESRAIQKIWYGPTRDGSWNPDASVAQKSGVQATPDKWWWPLAMGSNFSGQITNASADAIAQNLNDVRYAADKNASGGALIENNSTATRNKWQELDFASYYTAMERALAEQPRFSFMNTDKTDLRKIRDGNKKILMYAGLAEDSIPPQGAIHYVTRVAETMGGGMSATQNFFRLYMLPGSAHSSQGRGWTPSGKNNTVPLPQLPGNGNQNPTPAQDPFFSALVQWVEKGIAPETFTFTSRDGSTSLPACVFPLKPIWNGTGSSKSAASYRCA